MKHPETLFQSFVIGTALTSTALGTVLPILRDRGELRGRFGTVMSAFGAVGEFGAAMLSVLLLPLLAMRLRGRAESVPRAAEDAETW